MKATQALGHLGKTDVAESKRREGNPANNLIMYSSGELKPKTCAISTNSTAMSDVCMHTWGACKGVCKTIEVLLK